MGIKKAIAMALAFFTFFGGTVSKTDKKDKADDHYVYEHVIIIGVDGAGNFHRSCDTPNMDRIFIENGAWTDYCRAATPSISAQCWGSMLIGVKPYIHKLTNDIVVTKEYKNEDYPTIFRLVKNAHPDAKMGAYCNWDPIYWGIIEQDLGVKYKSGNDAEVAQAVLDYISREKPELLFVQFDSVDHAGHSHEYGTEEFNAALKKVDTYIGKIYAAIEQAGILDSTLFIITADHGGVNMSHGGSSDAEMNTFFGAVGKSINKTGDIEILGRDLAAIVCYALGVEGNDKWDSYIPQNMFLDNMTPEKRPEETYAEHENAATPEAGTPESIENFIDTDALRAGLFFDDGLTDIIGRENAETIGTVYYPEGYYGSSLRVSSEGYLSFTDMKFGKDSFTIGFWIKADEDIEGDPAIFSNKNLKSGKNKGFTLSYNGVTTFNVGNTGARDDFGYGDPENLTNWNHIIIVVDREAGTVQQYVNFGLTVTDNLSETLRKVSFDAGLPLNFGQDGTGEYKYSISAQFDDILIFDKALTEDEVAKLAEYYIK